MKKGNKKFLQILGGDVLESEFFTNQLFLLFIILVLCLIMVSMRYQVENLNKEKENLQKELSYMHEQRVQMQKQYQESIRISRIDKELDTLGIGLVAGPPYELKIESQK